MTFQYLTVSCILARDHVPNICRYDTWNYFGLQLTPLLSPGVINDMPLFKADTHLHAAPLRSMIFPLVSNWRAQKWANTPNTVWVCMYLALNTYSRLFTGSLLWISSLVHLHDFNHTTHYQAFNGQGSLTNKCSACNYRPEMVPPGNMVQPVQTKSVLQPAKAYTMCMAPHAETRPPPPI